MRKKLIFFFIFFFILSFYFIGVAQNCKSVSNIKTIIKSEISLFQLCINSRSVEDNIKNILKKNQILYKIASSLKKRFFPTFNQNIKTDDEALSKVVEKLYFEDKQNIKGFYNDDDKIKNLSVKETDNIKFDNWFRANANNFNNKYIDPVNIEKKDVKKIRLLAKIDSLEKSEFKNVWSSRIAANPIYAEEKIFYITASWEIVAVSAKDYSVIWKKDFDGNSVSKRGFLYHKDKNSNDGFLLVNSGSNLYKLNSSDGSLVKEFGTNGFVKTGMVLVPPVIFENQIILATIVDVRITSIDFNSGEILFSKDIFEENDSHFANPWCGAALDTKNGIYFIVTGNSKPGGILGNERPGPNKFSNSIIAFDVKKRKIIWSFQDVIHDLWDLDIAAPPVLANLKINNYKIEVVIVTTKSGNTYVFERKSGKSMFDIIYKKAGKTNIPGERPSPVQPFPILPKKFSKIEFKKNDLRQELLNNKDFIDKFDTSHKYGWFLPPQIGKDIIFYGIKGGNNWTGSAYDPVNQNIYIPSNHIPYKIRLVVKSREKENTHANLKNYSLYQKKCSSCHGITRNGKWTQNYDIEKFYIPSLVGLNIFDSLNDKIGSYSKFLKQHDDVVIDEGEFKNIKKLFLSWDNAIKNSDDIYYEGDWQEFFADDGKLISKPPWGSITSINILNGRTNWSKPFGIENGEEIGLFNYGGVSLMSSDLLVATGAVDKMVSIIEASTGKTLWNYEMEAEGTSAPLIYNFNEKTYIAVIATGGLYPDSKRSSILYIFGI